MKLFPLVLKNVFRKKTRSILTILSILLPLFVICIMGTMLRALDSDPTGGRGLYRLFVRHKVSLTNLLPEAYEQKIRQLQGVVEVNKSSWFGGQYIDHSPRNMFARFAVSNPETQMPIMDEAKIVAGSEADWLADRSGALVGQMIFEKYGWKLGQKVTLKGDIYPVNPELTIRAVYQGPNETALYMHYKPIEEALPGAAGRVGWFWIKADSPESVDRLTREIDALFENSPVPTKSETEKQFQMSFVSMLGNVKLLITILCSIIVCVILLIAANTMAMSARERVTEIAVFRTLGFQKKTILGLVLGESLVLALFGGILGVVLFTVLFPGFKAGLLQSPMGGFAAGMKLFPEILAVAFGITVFIGIVSGLVPAIRSAQRSITDGLRQVG